jgi:NADH-quinone oxidoreductase subunit J
MTAELVLFFVLAVVAISSALAMLMSSNAVYSAIFLILNFSTIAIFYVMLSAPFIAMAQIAVYAGAIMVLFLFVVMLLGSQRLGGSSRNPWQQPVAIALGVLLLGEVGYFFVSRSGGLQAAGTTLVQITGSPQDIGHLLFSQYVFPFEVTSILLLVAMVGVIVLTQSERK